MKLYIDLRCEQSPDSRTSEFVLAVLRGARPFLGDGTRTIGIVDGTRPALAESIGSLVDEFQKIAHPRERDETAIFLQPDPFSADPEFLLPLLGRPRILSCTLVSELPANDGADWKQRLWLKRYRLFFTLTEEIAQRLRDEFKLAPDRVKVIESVDRIWEWIRAALPCVSAPRVLPAGYRRPRLALLTPWIPDKTGVADYSAACVEALAERAVVDVFTPTRELRRDASVRNFFPVTARAYGSGEYDRVVAVLGNSRFHQRIVELHTAHGGACIQHDNRSGDLYYWDVDGGDAERFAARTSRYVGYDVTPKRAFDWLVDPSSSPTLFFDDMLPRAEPFIVHSRATQQRIEEIYGIRAEYLPFCLHHPFTEGELSDRSRRDSRLRLGLPENRIVVISLGYVAPAKAPEICIEALAKMIGRGVPAELYFVGDPASYLEPYRRTAREFGVEAQTHFYTDWIAESTFRDFLRAADFAIQLRRPGFVSMSGALSDCIGAGLPCVANDSLAEPADAPDFVYRVPDELDAETIAAKLIEGYRQDRHRLRSTGEWAAYVEARSFRRYAVELLKVLKLT